MARPRAPFPRSGPDATRALALAMRLRDFRDYLARTREHSAADPLPIALSRAEAALLDMVTRLGSGS